MTLNVFYHPLYTDGIDPDARFPRDRYRLLAQRLAKYPNIQLIEPRQATLEELTLAHDPAYVERFITGTLSDREIRTIGLKPWKPEIVPRTLHLTGGSLQALEHVLEHGGVAGNLAGGTHHAFKESGAGYCVFNDIAVCALIALKKEHINRVLVLDLDVHQGDGTAAMLGDHPDVFTCSIHGAKNFPFRKQKSDLDIELADDANDFDYLNALDRVLCDHPLNTFDLILFQAGVDALSTDRLGRLAITREGMAKRNDRVLSAAQAAGVPIVVLMGGGYSEPIEHTVDAFEDLFGSAAAFA